MVITPLTLCCFSIVSYIKLCLHYTALLSKISSLLIGGVLVICRSSSNIIITVAVSAVLFLPALFLTDTLNKQLQISTYVVVVLMLMKLCSFSEEHFSFPVHL